MYDLKVTSAQLRFVNGGSLSNGQFLSSDDVLYTLRSIPTEKYSASELKLTTEAEALDLTLEIVEYLSPESIRRKTQIYGECGEKDQTGCEMLPGPLTAQNPQLIPLNKYAMRDITRTLLDEPNDQEVPDAKFWSVGGFRPSLGGDNFYFGSSGAPVFLDVVLEYKERSRCKGGGKGGDHD